MKIKALYEKYKDIVPYAVFGVLTTVVNIAAYWVSAHLINLGVMCSTMIAWFLAVLFAYITNRKWVFHSEETTLSGIRKEVLSFFTCRFATGVVDWLCMFIFVDMIGLNDVVIKTLANIAVIILNYVASKLVIFKHKDKTK